VRRSPESPSEPANRVGLQQPATPGLAEWIYLKFYPDVTELPLRPENGSPHHHGCLPALAEVQPNAQHVLLILEKLDPKAGVAVLAAVIVTR
jgi:hypothetical protein